MLLNISFRFFPGIDLMAKVFALGIPAPLEVFGHKRQVAVVGLTILIKNSNCLAGAFEVLRVERRIGCCQSRRVQPVLFIFGKLRRSVANSCRVPGARANQD